MWRLPEARWHYVLSKRPHPGTSSSPLLELKIVLTDDPTLQPCGPSCWKEGNLDRWCTTLLRHCLSLTGWSGLWRSCLCLRCLRFMRCPPTIFYLQYTDKMVSFAFVVNGKKEKSREPLEHQLPKKKKMLQPKMLQKIQSVHLTPLLPNI